ncbi:MAG: hypothetical protein HN344_04595, partial [Gammaproteobacteria bacterium]|nr:hypothetical protein [Gammaproteobacteria bacterium]
TAHAPAMPDLVYAHAKKLMRSRVTGQGKRISGTGAFNIKTRKPMLVAQNKYDWGGRLPAGMTPKLKPHHTTDIHAGMVKMGNKGHSQYMTFRVMGEWQTNKWLVPPKPGLFIAQKVAGEMKPAFEKAMSVAVEQMIF